MVTTELGACEWFVWDLRRSNLIDRGRLDQVIGEFLGKNPSAEPPALAEYLIQQGILTDFQAERLLQGKTQGFVLGPFTLMDALGTGSMGTVYKAQSKTDNNWYAVKVLPRRSMWNVRIARRKVRAFEQCKHPAVVPFVDVGTAGGMHYLAWPLVGGTPLDKVIQEKGRLDFGLAAYYGLQIAEGLDICHTQGLIHGLVKPSNLMIGDDHQVYILDFGIGCLLAETEGESLVDTMSTANAVASGLDCSSPESIMDPTNLTPQGDQYSLGCILYFMLTGQYPFPDGSAAEKMMAHQFKKPTPIAEINPDVPADLIEIVDRLMAKAPEGRFSNAGELVDHLRQYAVKPTNSGQVARPRLPSGPAAKPAPAQKQAPDNGRRPNSNAPQVSPASVSPRPATMTAIPRPNLSPAASAPVPPPQPQQPSRLGANGGNKTAPRPGTVASAVRPSTMAAIPQQGNRSPAPSTPTPQPQNIGTLPTRSSLRGNSPSNHGVPQVQIPKHAVEDDAVDFAESEGNYPATDKNLSPREQHEGRPLRWEERLGPFGVAFIAVMACSAVFLAARWFNIF